MSHREFCERFLAATKSGDALALRDMLHPDFELEEATALPYAGVYRGLDGWLQLSKAVVSAWSKFRLEFLEYAGESPDTLIVRFRISGRSRTTDKPFETTVLELWRFRDGKLAQILPYYFDTHSLVIANT